jgi:hypothetical protein
MRRLSLVIAAGVAAWACKSDGEGRAPDAGPRAQLLSRAELIDPETCKGCHPKHYQEWSSSMHAYASIDPVFVAMNARGQRETDGELGDFCVKCHAPMALREGLTRDGTELADLPKAVQGVTCYFCHNAVAVGPEHVNAPIELADDTVMRGGIRNPVDPQVHGAAYSELHDNGAMAASVMCGACHDVKTPKGVHIERTLKEYRDSIFSIDRSGKMGGDTCLGCHMRAATHYVAHVPGTALPERDVHEHRWAAVDVALSDFPDREAHRHATECELSADGASVFEVFNDGRGGFEVSLETSAGHAQPSGSAQDRRMWLEFVAYDGEGNVMFQSGVIADGESEEWPVGHPKHDSQLWLFRDRLLDADGREVHMFWEAEQFESYLLPIAVDALTLHVAKHTYRLPNMEQPARVEMRLRMRPIGVDVLQALVDSCDLASSVIEEMPTFTLHSTEVEWKAADGALLRRPRAKPMPIDCP